MTPAIGRRPGGGRSVHRPRRDHRRRARTLAHADRADRAARPDVRGVGTAAPGGPGVNARTIFNRLAAAMTLLITLALPSGAASANTRFAAAENTHLLVVVGLGGRSRACGDVPTLGGDTRRSRGGPPRHPDGPDRLSARRRRSRTQACDRTSPPRRRSTRRSERSPRAAGEDDVVFIVLIGHGTFDGKVAKFNLRGPDMTPADFAALLKRFSLEEDRVREHGERQRSVHRSACRHRAGRS